MLKIFLTKNEIETDYKTNGLTIDMIAKKYGITKTHVIKHIKYYKIIPNHGQSKTRFLTKELLEKEYYENKLSHKKIAEKYNLGKTTIENKFKLFKIKRRDRTIPIGTKFYDFTIIEYLGHTDAKNTKRGYIYTYLCQCVCGNLRKIPSGNLKSGTQKSCGCKHKTGYKEISGEWWGGIRTRARLVGIEFSLTIQEAYEIYQKQKGKCYYTNLPISLTEHIKNKGTASLDRVDSSQGYIKGNVVWCHKNINAMKGCNSKSDFIKLCHLVVKKFPKTKKHYKNDIYTPHQIIRKKHGKYAKGLFNHLLPTRYKKGNNKLIEQLNKNNLSET